MITFFFFSWENRVFSAVGAAAGRWQERWWLAMTHCKCAACSAQKGETCLEHLGLREWARGVAVGFPLSFASRRAESWHFSQNFSSDESSSRNPQYTQAMHTGRTVTLHSSDANANLAAAEGPIQPGLWDPQGPQFLTTIMPFLVAGGKARCPAIGQVPVWLQRFGAVFS